MAEFLLEFYVSRTDPGVVESGAERARHAAERLTRERGSRVRFVRSIFVPGEETCFYLYEASSVDDVQKAVRRAALTISARDASARMVEPEGAHEEGEAR